MKKQSKEILSSQIKSIVIYQFLNLFNEIELLIREKFEGCLADIKNEELNRLYFLYGGKIGTFFEYETDTMRLTEMKFNPNEKFKNLTITQIIKLNKKVKIIKEFEKEIKSIQRESTVFDFQDSVIKLINMRNILSHELVECVFKDKDVIELLSDEKIFSFEFDFLANYDFKLMDDSTKAIISNYAYMLDINKIMCNT